jgi:hypothetical protein
MMRAHGLRLRNWRPRKEAPPAGPPDNKLRARMRPVAADWPGERRRAPFMELVRDNTGAVACRRESCPVRPTRGSPSFEITSKSSFHLKLFLKSGKSNDPNVKSPIQFFGLPTLRGRRPPHLRPSPPDGCMLTKSCRYCPRVRRPAANASDHQQRRRSVPLLSPKQPTWVRSSRSAAI